MPDDIGITTMKTDGACKVRQTSTPLDGRQNAFFLFSFSTAAIAEGAGV